MKLHVMVAGRRIEGRRARWHGLRKQISYSTIAQNEESMHRRIQLSWIGSWRAYAVRIERGRVIGLVRCRVPHLPFKRDAEFLTA